MLYRDTATNVMVTDSELIDSLRQEILALDDEQLLKAEYNMYGDLAIREYLIEASLVGLYISLDGSEVVARRVRDNALFTADEVEANFDQNVRDPAQRAEISFATWLGEAGFVESSENE